MTSRGSGSEGSRPLTDREEEIARRVRRALHLPSSMSEREVAQRFRGSVAWRRARLGRTGEELRDGLADALRPLVHRLTALWKRFWR